ncbi:hypothetical protein GCM10025856_10920 [Methylophaga marina]|uniref:hypothetical protein n=1 Tax=Methylophaga marina TaxID=45495 RepID=UPI002573FD7A|nr:hypothetical protein [Methylophaga marina]BDZ73373.1 hypothetical protein GCM10025856_10920 [Methylophaga marina]
MTDKTPMYQKLFVLEMANNHQGDIAHGKQVIQQMKQVCDDFPFQFAFKLQYRNLKTFIHPDYRDRQDIKYVKRFRDTELDEAQLLELKKPLMKQALFPCVRRLMKLLLIGLNNMVLIS